MNPNKEKQRLLLQELIEKYVEVGGKVKVLPPSDDGKNRATWGRFKRGQSIKGKYRRT